MAINGDGIAANNVVEAALGATALLGIPYGMSVAAGLLAIAVRWFVQGLSPQPEQPASDQSAQNCRRPGLATPE